MSGRKNNFQGRAKKIGDAFERWCALTLESIGFALCGKLKIKEAGIEIDQVAENRNGGLLYFQLKGSSKPPQQGLRRSDTVKKALCDAFLMEKLGIGPYVVVTSHKPKPGSSGAKMIECAGDAIFDIICINDDTDFARLQSYVDVLPWRTKAVAKSSSAKAAPVVGPAQTSLLGIESLRRFSGKKKLVPEKPAKAHRKKS